jgi:His-Xaa-Ser system protein HxsD
MESRVTGESRHEIEFVEHAIELVIDLRCYRLSAIKKAAYRFAERFTAILGSIEQGHLGMSLRFKTTVTEASAREATRMFFQELLDQELREQIAEETNPVRTLILAHAFSNLDLIKRGE